ncbi:MAG: pentapeptide repeat-containing protein, partial [Cyanobacteria bacterium P01_A01_bin.105]
SEAKLDAADLTQADLQSTMLQQASFKHAQLTQANLRGANLRGACLRWADLRGADLRETDLTGAKFSGADLTGANLQGANLTQTSFIHADLTRVNLMYTQWQQADVTEAQLTGVKLYGSSRFHLTTRNLRCEWVDLSADGQGRDLCYFRQPKEIHAFFNRVQPTVQVLIDAPLSLAAHAELVRCYVDIAAAGTVPLSVSPSITVDSRQTRLQFPLRQDRALFTLACGATLPFLSHRLLLRHLALLTGRLQTHDLSQYSPPQRQRLSILIYALVDLCHSFPRYARLSRQQLRRTQLDHWADFAAQPLQVELTNSSGQRLTLYRSPGWGVRCAAADVPSAISLDPIPSLALLLEFLQSSRVEAVALRRRSRALPAPTGPLQDRWDRDVSQ